MKRRWNLTLGQVFLLTLIGLTFLLGILFYVLLDGSRRSILQSSDRLRLEVGKRLRNQVVAFRDQATAVTDDVERQLQHHLVSIDDRDGLESALYTQVLNHPDISEVTLTHADATGDDGEKLLFAPGNRWEVSVYRGGDGGDPDWIIERRVIQIGNEFVPTIRDTRQKAPAATEPDAVEDPTTHLTFASLTLLVNLQTPVWSDLHWSELVPGKTRVEVTVQKAVFDGTKFLGVVRVGLLEKQLDRIVARNTLDDSSENTISHTCFLCDPQGRLVTSVTPSDQLAVDDDDLRISSPAMPPEIRAALDSIKTDIRGGEVFAAGTPYLVTFLPLQDTRDWILGVVGSEESYLGDLIQTQHTLLLAALVVMVVILAGGALTLRAVQRGLARVIGTTSRMREFNFAPGTTEAPFRNLEEVLESLEQAKTAMRAMGKYVPVDLVRDLYHMNREPVLGGELRSLSILFTDIQGFTTLAETLSPDRLAVALGHYFQAMTAAIHAQSGVIDKFIGDSVMAIWNAPRPCIDDAAKACAAALACVSATQRLFASENWQGLPPLVTRFGLHRDEVMVGHYGAPDRMSYTALGDGVNLTSRLEGLNKQYGTTIIVSHAIQQAAADKFQFRLLDRVAVKGKKQAVQVYELLAAGERGPAVQIYESALQAYWGRDFLTALNMLATNQNDPPSVILVERCRQLIAHPPPGDWDGVYISMTK